jgi:hypothetical protein
MSSGWRWLAVVMAALALVATAGAQVISRAPVGVSGRNATQGYVSTLFVQLSSPAAYGGKQKDIDTGDWTGPHWQSSSVSDRNGNALIHWRVEFDNHIGSAAAAAKGALVQGWPALGGGAISVPHLIGSRKIGVIKGTYTLTRDPTEHAQFEAGVGFPLCKGLFVGVGLFSDKPDQQTDVVKGTPGAAPDWNKAQITASVAGVAVQGNLPPGRIAARAAGGAVVGTALDCQGQPYALAKIALQDSGGRTVSSGKTDLKGGFRLRAAGKGTFRVVVAYSEEFGAKSAPVRA